MDALWIFILFIRKFKKRYPDSATITKHRLPGAPKRRTKQIMTNKKKKKKKKKKKTTEKPEEQNKETSNIKRIYARTNKNRLRTVSRNTTSTSEFKSDLLGRKPHSWFWYSSKLHVFGLHRGPTSRKHAYIMLIPSNPHFYIVKLGFTLVYIIFLISAHKHRLWVLVRTALWGGSKEYPQSMFWAEIWKISECFIWKF